MRGSHDTAGRRRRGTRTHRSVNGARGGEAWGAQAVARRGPSTQAAHHSTHFSFHLRNLAVQKCDAARRHSVPSLACAQERSACTHTHVCERPRPVPRGCAGHFPQTPAVKHPGAETAFRVACKSLPSFHFAAGASLEPSSCREDEGEITQSCCSRLAPVATSSPTTPHSVREVGPCQIQSTE